ncbi:20229_t:CDS:1, partial [Gigaspora margarita]
LNASTTKIRSKFISSQKALSVSKARILSFKAKIRKLEYKLEELKLDQIVYNSNLIEEPNKQEEVYPLEKTTLDLTKSTKYKLSNWVNNSLKDSIYYFKLEDK